MPGESFGDMRAGRVRTLLPSDAEALASQPYVDSVTPQVSSSATLRYGNVSLTASISGVGPQFFRVRGYTMADGQIFNDTSVERRAQEAVIDTKTRDEVFKHGVDPIGEVIFLGTVPVRVIGVANTQDSAFGSSDALNVWIPYTTAMNRVLGQNYLQRITVRVSDEVASDVAERNIQALLTRRQVQARAAATARAPSPLHLSHALPSRARVRPLPLLEPRTQQAHTSNKF